MTIGYRKILSLEHWECINLIATLVYLEAHGDLIIGEISNEGLSYHRKDKLLKTGHTFNVELKTASFKGKGYTINFDELIIKFDKGGKYHFNAGQEFALLELLSQRGEVTKVEIAEKITSTIGNQAEATKKKRRQVSHTRKRIHHVSGIRIRFVTYSTRHSISVITTTIRQAREGRTKFTPRTKANGLSFAVLPLFPRHCLRLQRKNSNFRSYGQTLRSMNIYCPQKLSADNVMPPIQATPHKSTRSSIGVTGTTKPRQLRSVMPVVFQKRL